MKFMVRIYKSDEHIESWVDYHPDYYELHRMLEKCEIFKFEVAVL